MSKTLRRAALSLSDSAPLRGSHIGWSATVVEPVDGSLIGWSSATVICCAALSLSRGSGSVTDSVTAQSASNSATSLTASLVISRSGWLRHGLGQLASVSWPRSWNRSRTRSHHMRMAQLASRRGARAARRAGAAVAVCLLAALAATDTDTDTR
eukprot:276361-Prorocentrum_minimum.AAC.1